MWNLLMPLINCSSFSHKINWELKYWSQKSMKKMFRKCNLATWPHDQNCSTMFINVIWSVNLPSLCFMSYFFLPRECTSRYQNTSELQVAKKISIHIILSVSSDIYVVPPHMVLSFSWGTKYSNDHLIFLTPM